MVKEEGDPLDALVDRYLTTYLCPTKHQGIQDHQALLLREVQESGAKGVIFIFYKYCESYYFDYPDIKKLLEGMGFPTLLLEDQRSFTIQGTNEDQGAGLCGNAFRNGLRFEV